MSLNRAIQRELDSFFKKITSSDYSIREATKGAFSQARAKLNAWAFVRLNQVAVESFYDGAEYYTWHQYRLLAVDGTRLVLPNHPSIIEEFGQHSFGPKADAPRCLAIASMLYDVLNHVTLDAQIAPYHSSEKELLAQHMPCLKKGDLLLLDRGYPSYALLFLLKAQGIEFCVRLKDSWWLKAKSFVKSGKKEQVVTFTLPKRDKKKLSSFPGWAEKELKVRLVRVELEGGQVEVLCPSLIDQEKYPFSEFKELYHYRWDEEEAYKLLKSRIELENFSGKTAKAVRQDFHAKVFLLTLSAAYAHPVQERVKQEYKADKNRKHNQKINRTNSIAMTKEILVPLFIKKHYENAIEAFDKIVSSSREILRPNRKVKRKHKPKKPYSMNYKRL